MSQELKPHDGNPHRYEAGFTIEQHRDELIGRLGSAIKQINQLERTNAALLGAAKGLVGSLTKGNRGDDRMLSIDNHELRGLLANARAAIAEAESLPQKALTEGK